LKAIIDEEREEKMNTMPNTRSFRIRRGWRKPGMVSNVIESTKVKRPAQVPEGQERAPR
jgi:hypothetical protein